MAKSKAEKTVLKAVPQIKATETDITTRQDIFILVEAVMSNLNGDPDNNGAQRIDPSTGHGIATPDCLCRIARDYIETEYEGQPGKEIYDGNKKCCNEQAWIVAEEAGFEVTGKGIKRPNKGESTISYECAQISACQKYIDLRASGGVITQFATAGLGSGGIQGAFQVGIFKSVEPIEVVKLTLSRRNSQKKDEFDQGIPGSFGARYYIPYGLFLGHAVIMPDSAKKNGFTREDMETYLDALVWGCNGTHSRTRNEINVRGIYILNHSRKNGNVLQSQLQDFVTAKRISERPAARFEDYKIVVKEPPKGATVINFMDRYFE